MRNDHGAARELLQSVFQRAQGLNVQVVGRLVEEDQVAALFERQRQVEAVALTAGKHLRRLLLVRALEAERGQVRARRHLVLADVDVVEPARDDLPDRGLGVDVLAVLVNVGQLDGLAHLDRTGIRLLQAHDGLEQRGLAHAVRADDADDAVARQGERQILDQRAAVEALVEVVHLHDLVTQARRGRDLNFFEVELLVLLGLGRHLLVALQTSLVLRLASLCTGANPRELFLQALAQLRVLLTGNLEALLLLVQVGGVVALVRVELAAVDLADPARDVVEEVAVVGHGQDRARVVGQVLLQPQDGLGVQVVGRLVEEQQVRLGKKQLGQGHAAALTTGEVFYRSVRRRAAQRLHRLLDLGVDLPRVRGVELLLQLAHFFHELVAVVGGHLLGDLFEALLLFKDVAQALLDVFAHGLGIIQRRLLLEDAHRGARIQEGLAVGRLVHPGHDLQNRRLAGTVRADNADLGARVKGHGDVIQNDLVTDGLAHVFHRVDELAHVFPSHLLRG